MSLVFSNAAGKSGIVERLDRKVKTTGSNAYPIEEKTSDINEARNAFTVLALKASGKWQADDANQDKQPIITADLVAGQRDYMFDTDEDGNMILEVESVMVADQNSFFRRIHPVDPQSEVRMAEQQFYNGQNVQGIPYQYDKTGNVLSFNPIPSYSLAGGIKMYITRESTYYETTDTDKPSGFPGIFDEYLVIHPAYQYASRNGLSIAGGVLRNGSITGLLREVNLMEAAITKYFGSRAKDERIRFVPRLTRFR